MRKIIMLLAIAAGIGMASGSAHAASGSTDQPEKHKVATGESLSSIAADNQLENWRPIWNANAQLSNPDVISVDQELTIPSKPTTDRPLPDGYGSVAPVAATAPVTHHQAASHRVSTAAPSGDIFARIRARESGGNYATNTGNGYYGAYQYNDGTWGGYGGYRHASDAPAEVQDAKAHETYAARGCSPWPNTCY